VNILFVTFYFPPEVGAPQRRIWETAQHLKKRGHRVQVLTGFPNYPRGEIIPPYQRRLFQRENMEGLEVLRVWHGVGNRSGKWGRAFSEGSFAMTSALAALLEAAPDVVIVESPSLLSCWTGVLLKRMRSTAFVMHVSDLIPDMALELGMLSRGWLTTILDKMSAFFYKEADALIVVTDGLGKTLAAKGIQTEKVHLIRNGVEDHWFANGTEDPGSKASFQIVYFGNHGVAQNLSVILDAASLLVNEEIVFNLFGDGIEKTALVEKAQRLGLEKVCFHPSLPQLELADRLQRANAVIVPLCDRPGMEKAVPSKLIEAMAAGKPVILSARGESAELVREAQAGLVVEPDNPKALAEAICRIRENPEEAKRMGENGREFVRQNFLRSVLVDKLEKLLIELVEEKRQET